MTDKQIIIDEFNASEYAKTAFELAKETLAEKDQLREYYDKQLKRKEQECEELKEQLTILDDEDVVVEITVKQFEEYKNLKAENETLFKAIEEVNKINKRLETENEILEKDKANLEVIKETLKVQFKQLKQTLAEIKEIAESEMDSKEVMAVQYMLNGSVDNKNKVLKQILQKINECEMNDERI